MKIKTLAAGALLAASAGVFAVGDPGFERTEPQELPLWSGALWAKASTAKYSAKIVEDAKEAAEGKRFLRVENPNKTSVYVMAYPSIKRIPGYGMKTVLDQESYAADPAHFTLNWVPGPSATGKPCDSFIIYQRDKATSKGASAPSAWYVCGTNRIAYLKTFTKK